jgi:hypothetical protein
MLNYQNRILLLGVHGVESMGIYFSKSSLVSKRGFFISTSFLLLLSLSRLELFLFELIYVGEGKTTILRSCLLFIMSRYCIYQIVKLCNRFWRCITNFITHQFLNMMNDCWKIWTIFWKLSNKSITRIQKIIHT